MNELHKRFDCDTDDDLSDVFEELERYKRQIKSLYRDIATFQDGAMRRTIRERTHKEIDIR
jgi:hypothetical protein